jgi:DNA modification methylase
VVLDPFAGTGTVGEVAIQHRRRFVGLDLSRPYLVDLATERLAKVNCTTVKVGKRDEYLQLGLLTRDH